MHRKAYNASAEDLRKLLYVHALLGRYHWVEKCLNGVAKYLERFRILAQGSLEDFCVYTHYERVGAIPT